MKFLVLALLCAIFVWESVSAEPDNYTVDCSDLKKACFVPKGHNIKICFPPPGRVSDRERQIMGYTAQNVSSVIKSAIQILPDSKSITEAIVRITWFPDDKLRSRIRLLNSAYSAGVIYQYFRQNEEKPFKIFYLSFPPNRSIVVFTIDKYYQVSPGILIPEEQQEMLYQSAYKSVEDELKDSGITEEQDLKDQVRKYSNPKIYPSETTKKIIYNEKIATGSTASQIQEGRVGQLRRFLLDDCMEEIMSIAGITSIPIILFEKLPTFTRSIKHVGIGNQVCESNDDIQDDPEFDITLLTSPRQTCTIILDDGSTPHDGHDVKGTSGDPNTAVISLRPLQLKAGGIKCFKAKTKYELTLRKPTDDDEGSTSSV